MNQALSAEMPRCFFLVSSTLPERCQKSVGCCWTTGNEKCALVFSFCVDFGRAKRTQAPPHPNYLVVWRSTKATISLRVVKICASQGSFWHAMFLIRRFLSRHISRACGACHGLLHRNKALPARRRFSAAAKCGSYPMPSRWQSVKTCGTSASKAA